MEELFQTNMWENFLYISSADTSQQFLHNKYQLLNIDEAYKMSFENSYIFIHYIEQGKHFFNQAKKSPITIKPILLFYGLSFLIKACLLTTDPYYPESTSVLAHGVSTRKRKKQNYEYLMDEVKIQKNGLFPHFSDKLFHMKHLTGEKFTIENLLKEIPELNNMFQVWQGTNSKIVIEKYDKKYTFPEDILDHFNMTKERFIHFIETKFKQSIQFETHPEQILFTFKKDVRGWECLPFRYHINKGKYYFPKKLTTLSFYYELMIHYLILYHLSMIARYEIEWWSEVIYQRPSIEYPLINQYINICFQKCPYLINQYLFNESF